MNTISRLVLLLLVFSLTACKSNRFFETDYPISTIIQLDDIHYINQSVDLVLHYPNDEISDIQWAQNSGTPVTILTPNSKVISFTATEAGEYEFIVSFLLNNETTESSFTTVIIEETNSKLTARLSHVVQAQNQVSFRAQVDPNLDSSLLVWHQTSGPSARLPNQDSNDSLNIFFDAPNVDNDTLLTFEVSITGLDGEISYSDRVAVIVEPMKEITNNAYFTERVAKVFPYNNNSQYASHLAACVYSNTLTSSCTFEQTPLLAAEVANSNLTPDVDTIMDRVLVSHQWMGDRFKEFLTNDDGNNDFKYLLRATTAIVISYDIRPSFYWAATGAIYLDPENLWLTPQERDTINEAEDFRSDFGAELQFVMPWRYVKDNDYASESFNRSERQTRTTTDNLYKLSALLYHELAHANDFFPKNEWYSHQASQRVLDAATSTNWESDELAVAYPLLSQEMHDLARVRFSGEEATDTQKSYLPTDIEGFFADDIASDFYAYTSEREDLAMLFEELMMQSRFDVLRDTAVTNKPTGDIIYITDYIVTWGQRGRVGEPTLTDRVLFSAERIFPEFDSLLAMENIAVPIPMIVGDDWLENLTISVEPQSINSFSLKSPNLKTQSASAVGGQNKQQDEKLDLQSHRYFHKQLPHH